MQNAAQAYGKTAKTVTLDQRELEADLFMRAAAKLQDAAQDVADTERLEAALEFNKRVWAVMLPAIVDPENPLPPALKGNLASLGVFVFRRMDEVIVERKAEGLSILVTINTDIAAGLRGRAA
ncbi:flagellar biosynthesis regulator FlaF [Salinarimonas sp.]|uniref:flagellar biosynthesis regulator FlaF n=1 Tax=Salinarimonas sp. TaxID=2766526 RepID=UPI00391B08CF